MSTFFGLQLNPLVADILRLSLWLTALVVIFVPLERLFGEHDQKVLRKGIVTDLGYYFLSSLLPALLLSLPLAGLAWAVHLAVPSGWLAVAGTMPLWARALAGLVAGEVGYYWGHRWSHEIPLLWRFHAIHHSAQELDFLVHTRAHPVDMVFGRFCAFVPIYVLGLGSPVDVSGSVVPVIVGVVGTLWGFFIHANVRWRFGPLEWIISSPAFHHWHHTLDGPINRNYASTLPWLDRLFGTHYLPRHEMPKAYGIRASVPDTLSEQILHPFLPQPASSDEPRGQAGDEQSGAQDLPAPLSTDAAKAEARLPLARAEP